jgi:hypothetical protein
MSRPTKWRCAGETPAPQLAELPCGIDILATLMKFRNDLAIRLIDSTSIEWNR